MLIDFESSLINLVSYKIDSNKHHLILHQPGCTACVQNRISCAIRCFFLKHYESLVLNIPYSPCEVACKGMCWLDTGKKQESASRSHRAESVLGLRMDISFKQKNNLSRPSGGTSWRFLLKETSENYSWNSSRVGQNTTVFKAWKITFLDQKVLGLYRNSVRPIE